MGTQKIRLGLAEYVTLAGLLMVAGIVAAAVAGGWTIALVPGLAYVLAVAATYALYRQYINEKTPPLDPTTASTRSYERPTASDLGHRETAGATISFRVIGTHGVCPLGRGKGDRVTVDPSGSVAPQVCQYAEVMLRLAATAGEEQKVKAWCCPIFDHYLVFQREPEAVLGHLAALPSRLPLGQ